MAYCDCTGTDSCEGKKDCAELEVVAIDMINENDTNYDGVVNPEDNLSEE